MTMRTSQNKASELQALHLGPSPLLLPNAWDVISARIFENAGFRAVGTTSAGIAATLGVPDGERVSREEMLAVVERIVRAVSLPVSADIEAGYGATIAEVRETARAVIQTGAVGVNIEDGIRTPEHRLTDLALQVEKIRAFREIAEASSVSLVINARVDVFLLAIGEPADRFEMAVQRANAYRQAGADCLFLPGVNEAKTIAQLVHAIHGPINILAGAGTPSISELARLGVARVSVGSGPMRATVALTRRIAEELLEQGTYTTWAEDTVSLAELTQILR
jgi:2-methylisocitrate lyase-like PEP mutase family enzyme